MNKKSKLEEMLAMEALPFFHKPGCDFDKADRRNAKDYDSLRDELEHAASALVKGTKVRFQWGMEGQLKTGTFVRFTKIGKKAGWGEDGQGDTMVVIDDGKGTYRIWPEFVEKL